MGCVMFFVLSIRIFSLLLLVTLNARAELLSNISSVLPFDDSEVSNGLLS